MTLGGRTAVDRFFNNLTELYIILQTVHIFQSLS